MGTPAFAVPALRALSREHEVVAVYTRPDAVSRRGSRTVPSPVAEAAAELGIDIRRPATLRDPAVIEGLRSDAPDAVVVAAYGLILPAGVLAAPPLGCFNIHASLLPRWRGAAPIERAILAGDAETGVSIMRMEEGLDTGPYCVVERTETGRKTADEITAELAVLGADAISRALERAGEGRCAWTEQDEALVTYAEKIAKDDLVLEPELAVQVADRRVRASSAHAPARASIAGRGVRVLRAEPGAGGIDAGGLAVTGAGLELGLTDGSLLVTVVKPDGKREMDAADWARGLRLDASAGWCRP